MLLKIYFFWKLDLPFPKSLPNELQRWKTLWLSEQEINIIHHQLKAEYQTFLQALASCDVDSFTNIYQLLLIACTLPVTSAEAEHSFSLFRRIKTYMRSTMSETRMSDFGVIVVNYEVKIPVDDLCLVFVQKHPRRLFKPTLFDD